MKKIILIIIGCVVAANAIGQTRQFKITEVIGRGDTVTYINLVTKTIVPRDGMKIKFNTPPDTARLFVPDDGAQYVIEGTFRKVTTTTPPTSVVIAAKSFLSTSVNVSVSGENMVPNASAGGTAIYAVDWKAGKLKMRYAMASGGTAGVLTLKYGTVTKVVSIPFTAGWGVFSDLEIDVTAFAGNASFQFNRGLNVSSFTTP